MFKSKAARSYTSKRLHWREFSQLACSFPFHCAAMEQRFFILGFSFCGDSSRRERSVGRNQFSCVCTANQAEFKEAEYMSQWGLRCVYRYSWRLPATGLLARGLQVKGSTGCLICQTRVRMAMRRNKINRCCAYKYTFINFFKRKYGIGALWQYDVLAFW